MINGFIVLLPNIVLAAFESRRLQYDVGIGYGNDIDRAKELMLQAMQSVPEVVKDPSPDVLGILLIRVKCWRFDNLSIFVNAKYSI